MYVDKIVNCPCVCVCVWKKLVSFVMRECIIPQILRLCQFKLVCAQVWHWKKKGFCCLSQYSGNGQRPNILFSLFHLQLLITLIISFIEMLHGLRSVNKDLGATGTLVQSDIKIWSVLSDLTDVGWGGVRSNGRSKFHSKCH